MVMHALTLSHTHTFTGTFQEIFVIREAACTVPSPWALGRWWEGNLSNLLQTLRISCKAAEQALISEKANWGGRIFSEVNSLHADFPPEDPFE